VKTEYAVRLQPAQVGESRAVAEQHAGGDLAAAGIAREVAPRRVLGQGTRKVLDHRPVQVQLPLGDELHRQAGEGRLGERRPGEHGVFGQRQLALHVAQAERLRVDDLAVVQDGDAGAGYFGRAHEARYGAVDLFGRDRGAVEAADARRGGV